MNSPRRLVYFGHVPQEGAGSPIIVLRHLTRLAAAGWEICVVPEWGQDLARCQEAGWPVMTLSHRRPWWPPLQVDSAASRRIRGWLWASEVRAWVGNAPVDAVLTYVSAFEDLLPMAAVGFSRRYGIPLTALVHDDIRCFNSDAEAAQKSHVRRNWILQHAHKAWFASPELAACYDLEPQQVDVLPPIPEGRRSVPTPEAAVNQQEPLLIYAGNYWAPQLPTLAHIGKVAREAGGRLLTVIRDKASDADFLKQHGVEWMPPFERNVQALEYYQKHASALVVSYAPTSEDMPWTRTSFPSKLIEYCHLGLPIVIVAAEDTAIGSWAKSRQFPDFFAPHDTVGLTNYVARLRDPAFRRDRQERVLALANGEFNPDIIQQKLVDSLIPVSK